MNETPQRFTPRQKAVLALVGITVIAAGVLIEAATNASGGWAKVGWAAIVLGLVTAVAPWAPDESDFYND